MTYPVWQLGTLYQPGDIVVPITMPAPTATAPQNGDFSEGAIGWDFTGDVTYINDGHGWGGAGCARLPGNLPHGLALNKSRFVVPVGKTISATCMIEQGASIKGATRGWVEVHWFDDDDLPLGLPVQGTVVDDGSGGAWKQSSVSATAPAGAAYCRAGIYLWSIADHSHAIWGDALKVSGAFSGLPDGLAYRAVQPASGFSGPDEPAWPPVLGQQVTDNEVVWEAIAATRVVWEAAPLYVSGDTEPEWPSEPGEFVRDGTVTWQAVARRVEDENCPNTKVVAIAASKVFCGDGDIVRYCATVNPLDWSSKDDAGYLPTGLQNYGTNPVAALALYRGNLLAFNSEAFQLWQVDEDPAGMAFLDALPLGCSLHHTMAPVSNDLFFVASQGIRTVGIAASSTNFQAGDVGMPIDPLVQAAIKELGGEGEPMAAYLPSMGQYWLMFPRKPPPVQARMSAASAFSDPPGTLVFVYTMNSVGKVGSFSRYEFPFEIDDWTVAGDALYVRSGDDIHVIDPQEIGDEVRSGGDGGATQVVPAPGRIQWAFLDFGRLGQFKMLQAFDVIGTGEVSVSFGFDQRSPDLFTPPFPTVPDTVPGNTVPISLAAPSLSVRLDYAGDEPWQWNGLQLFLQDMR